MGSPFAAMLRPLYQRLGTDATFAHDGGTPRAVKVVFDLGGMGGSALGGMQLMSDPALRLQAADAPDGVARGDVFRIGQMAWRAREAGMPIGVGDELHVALQQA